MNVVWPRVTSGTETVTCAGYLSQQVVSDGYTAVSRQQSISHQTVQLQQSRRPALRYLPLPHSLRICEVTDAGVTGTHLHHGVELGL